MKRLAIVLALATAVGCGGGGGRTLIQSKGSDTLVNVAQAWAEAYATVDPNVAVAVSGGGSGVGLTGLIDGTTEIANSSRKIKSKEIEAARKHGIEPKEFVVGYDALAVYVHKDNPIEKITIAQLAGIYGDDGTITKWSQLGVTMPGGAQNDTIVRVSRQNNSGTYVYFKEAVLGEGHDYKLGSIDQSGSKDVVDLVARTMGAIGYSGLAYATPEVKLVPVAQDDAAPPVMPTMDTAIDGSYPIARPLFMYTAGEPQGAVKAYLDWILSDAGQKIIHDKGYAPVRKLD